MALFKIFSTKSVKDKLQKSSSKISLGIGQIFTHKKLDEDLLEELEDLLISSDIGTTCAMQIVDDLRKKKFNKQIDATEVKVILSQKIAEILFPCQKLLQFESVVAPQVVIFNGVNGSGKTTTIGKIAKSTADSGKKVMIAACDTFRAAACAQLKVWADRSNCQIIEPIKEGEDPASVAYRALKCAKEQNIDILLIDTAGRLQNKKNLMDELKKINNVLKKIDETAPHHNILVLDANTGQNAKNQLEVFDKIVDISGIIATKLDGSAKGGILVAIAREFSKPIYAVGVGEKIEDLREFNAQDFAQNLLGLDSVTLSGE